MDHLPRLDCCCCCGSCGCGGCGSDAFFHCVGVRPATSAPAPNHGAMSQWTLCAGPKKLTWNLAITTARNDLRIRIPPAR